MAPPLGVVCSVSRDTVGPKAAKFHRPTSVISHEGWVLLPQASVKNREMIKVQPTAAITCCGSRAIFRPDPLLLRHGCNHCVFQGDLGLTSFPETEGKCSPS